MDRAFSERSSGASDGAGDGDHPPAPLREAELPVRDGRKPARVGRPQLLRARPDQVRDARSVRGGAVARRDGALQSREGAVGGASQRRPRRAGRPSRASREDELSNAASLSGEAVGFERSDTLYRSLAGFLRGEEAGALAHEELEVRLRTEGRELERQLLQDHLDLRAMREVSLEEVADAHGVGHRAIEAGHHRPLVTIFGDVQVSRLAYRAMGQANLHPADAVLNLPAEHHSHGLRELAATESTRGSYEEASEAIRRATG